MRNSQILPKALVIEEEKGLVFLNGATQRTAKLIAVEGSPRRIKESFSIKILIPQEPISGAMEGIGARPRSGIDHAAGSSSVLRRVVAGEDRELLYGVNAHRDARYATGTAAGIILNADTIQAEIVLLRAGPRYAQKCSDSTVGSVGRTGSGCLRRNVVDAGREGCELHPIAPVQRQFRQRLGICDASHT